MSPVVNCPACGAASDLPAGETQFPCPYCGALIGSGSAATVIAANPEPAPIYESSATAMDDLKRMIREGRKIEAIHTHRLYFKTDLNESKRVVEQIELEMGLAPRVTSTPSFAADSPAPAPEKATMGADPFDAPPTPPGPDWKKWAIGCAAALFLTCCCLGTGLMLVFSTVIGQIE